jgi:hypothetical protein
MSVTTPKAWLYATVHALVHDTRPSHPQSSPPPPSLPRLLVFPPYRLNIAFRRLVSGLLGVPSSSISLTSAAPLDSLFSFVDLVNTTENATLHESDDPPLPLVRLLAGGVDLEALMPVTLDFLVSSPLMEAGEVVSRLTRDGQFDTISTSPVSVMGRVVGFSVMGSTCALSLLCGLAG